MDLSSINSALLSLQNQPGDQSSMGAIAAEDGQKTDPEASSGTGQDLPSAETAQAASATSGASSASLSPEMQALLLQAQEASAAAGLLLGQGGGYGDPLLGTATGGADPLLAAISGDETQNDQGFTPSTGGLSPDLIVLLTELQGGTGSTGDSPAVSSGSANDPSQSAALMQSILSDFLSSASANTTIGTSTQALLDLMGGTEAAGLAD